MPEPEPRRLLAAIDTSSELAGVALMEDGRLLAEVTWRTRQSHSRQLLPTLDWALSFHGRSKAEIGGLAVCLGPGAYAGLRVGISTAKALAYGLDVPIAGVGRLEADAEPLVAAVPGRVFAVHAAGRAELAWAAYDRSDGGMREVIVPGLGPTEDLLAALSPTDLVCGERGTMALDLLAALEVAGVRFAETAASRVVAVARLAQRRFDAAAFDNPDTLVPLYLRAPAIGPSPPR